MSDSTAAIAKRVAWECRDQDLLQSIAADIPDVTVERWAKRIQAAIDEAFKARGETGREVLSRFYERRKMGR